VSEQGRGALTSRIMVPMDGRKHISRKNGRGGKESKMEFLACRETEKYEEEERQRARYYV